MPNHCYNQLEVTGDEKQLQIFVEKSLTKYDDGEDRFTFNGTHPMPKELDITKGTQTVEEKAQAIINIANHNYADWYEWHVGEWGTKWDAYETNIQHNETDYFVVSFDTAWAPPTTWVQNIIQDFPDLCFELTYSEEGMGFGGKLTAQHDVIWDDLTYDLAYASECCEAQTYNEDDDNYSLTEEDIETEYGTGYQCSQCQEECETIAMDEADIKLPKIIETQKEFNNIVNKLKNNEN